MTANNAFEGRRLSAPVRGVARLNANVNSARRYRQTRFWQAGAQHLHKDEARMKSGTNRGKPPYQLKRGMRKEYKGGLD